MKDQDKSREVLIVEIARLRREFEEIRDRANRYPTADAIAFKQTKDAFGHHAGDEFVVLTIETGPDSKGLLLERFHERI